ncbi:hypothetical protein JL720_8928 [Aureococcus anophagefferens]|nr:hypothetical protein JL720_8928 [Aureococcus anophagefferens]
MDFVSSMLGASASSASVPRDLPEVARVAVEAPIKAEMLGGASVVWKFPIFAHAAGAGPGGAGPVRVTRSLEDANWLRRALLMKLPGLCVPPGPLVAYAESPHSVLSGGKPLTADMEVGASWLQVTEALGMGADAHADDADRDAKRRAEDLQAWVVSMERLLTSCETSTSAAADAKVALARSGRAAVDVAEALCEDRPLSAALKAKREEAAKKAVPLREGAHAFLRVCADERAWLATAQEALNMHEWCRRESATARRHLREHVASRDEREIQLRRAASRASESSDYGAQLASWAEQSHADAMLSTDADVAAATAAEDRLRARLVAAAALVHEELAKLQAFWSARLSEALLAYARSETFQLDGFGSIYAPRSAEDAAVAVAVPRPRASTGSASSAACWRSSFIWSRASNASCFARDLTLYSRPIAKCAAATSSGSLGRLRFGASMMAL